MENKLITREEQIIEAATSQEFIDGAKWADSHPMIKEEIVLKGFVAVDNRGNKMTWNPSGRRVTLFEKKPVRDTLGTAPYWASPSSIYSNIELNWDSFLHMSWEDEPIEVELKVIVK